MIHRADASKFSLKSAGLPKKRHPGLGNNLLSQIATLVWRAWRLPCRVRPDILERMNNCSGTLGRIPLAIISALGFPELRPGVRIRCGLYRAEFSHDRRSEAAVMPRQKTIHNLGRHADGPPPVEAWISWVDPGTKEPDFHVPASLGWLEFTK